MSLCVFVKSGEGKTADAASKNKHSKRNRKSLTDRKEGCELETVSLIPMLLIVSYQKHSIAFGP